MATEENNTTVKSTSDDPTTGSTTDDSTTTTKVKSTTVTVHEVENDAIIVNIGGWRIRVHFASSISKDKKESLRFGKQVKVKYEGSLDDVHSLKFKKLY